MIAEYGENRITDGDKRRHILKICLQKGVKIGFLSEK